MVQCFWNSGPNFGSQYIVRIPRNGVTVKRSFELPGYAERGQALYTAYARVDANINAPNGVAPIVYASLHA